MGGYFVKKHKSDRLENLQKPSLGDIAKYCLVCPVFLDNKEKSANGILTQEDIAYGRYDCWYCPHIRNNAANYRFDIVLSLGKRIGNVGKKETYERIHGDAIRNLKSNGMSIRNIAKTLGIGTQAVQDILHPENPMKRKLKRLQSNK